MKHQIKNIILSFLGLSFISTTCAYADEEQIRQSLLKSFPSISVDSIQESELKGLFEVVIGSSIIYVSEDGQYLLQGHLIQIEGKKDLTELKLADKRKQAIEKIGDKQSITFKPEKTKYKVTIFTDIDCGYCRKLHSELAQYHAEGIEIQYLFFPRAGKGSESYNKAVSTWCADDRKAAFTDAKNGKTIAAKTCENPIDEHMQLGVDFEVRGTPMIVTEKGNIFPGYVPAKQLARDLARE